MKIYKVSKEERKNENNIKIFISGFVMVKALCYNNLASAKNNFVTGGAAQSGGAGAAVNLDFQIVIPNFIYFRVGSLGAVIECCHHGELNVYKIVLLGRVRLRLLLSELRKGIVSGAISDSLVALLLLDTSIFCDVVCSAIIPH